VLSNKQTFIAVLLGSATLLPVWRSGGRTGLTFWGFLLNHTVFGPPIEYVPEEDYAALLDNSITKGSIPGGNGRREDGESEAKIVPPIPPLPPPLPSRYKKCYCHSCDLEFNTDLGIPCRLYNCPNCGGALEGI
jgi:hypothetical protein